MLCKVSFAVPHISELLPALFNLHTNLQGIWRVTMFQWEGETGKKVNSWGESNLGILEQESRP